MAQTQIARKGRNGGIELLRFIFCMGIVCLHGSMGCRSAYLGVEFFFLISGAFMARSLSRVKGAEESMSATCCASIAYLLKRVGAVFPYFLLSTVIATAVKIVSRGELVSSAVGAAADLLFLKNYGFPAASATGVLWYLSAMFFAMWLIYPVMRRYYDVFTRYIAPMLFLLITGFLMQTYATLEVPDEWFGVLNTGFLRAIAAMSLGAVAHVGSEYLARLMKASAKVRAGATVLEVLLWGGAVIYMTLWNSEQGMGDGMIVIAMGVAASIALSGQSLLAGKLDHPLTAFLGKASTVLFMNHFYWFMYLGDLLGKFGISLTPSATRLTALALSFATSAIVWCVGGWLMGKLTRLSRWAHEQLEGASAAEG